MKQIVILLLFFLFAETQAQQNNPVVASFDKKKRASEQFSYEVINSPNNTFGYDIYANGKIMIHQPTPPGMSGNSGFKKRSEAEKVAKFVIAKIRKGEMPPTVTDVELKKLGVN